MPDRIEAKVAGLLNARELVLNKGAADGVEIGMRFAILNTKGLDIRDPDTNERLDSLEIPKTVVKIVRVEQRVSVGRTFRTIQGNRGMSAVLQAISGSAWAGTPNRTETLVTDERRLTEELDESESYIKRGDPAVQTMGDEYTDSA